MIFSYIPNSMKHKLEQERYGHLTSASASLTVVLLDTGTPGTSREIYSEDADGTTVVLG